MLATQVEIEQVGERIERAYERRSPRMLWAAPRGQACSVAAAKLLQLHRQDPTIPVDPELFVAVQPLDDRRVDPWLDLTQEASLRLYRRQVRRIVRGLGAELGAEVRRAERRAARGEALESVFSPKARPLSPLACYIVARRAGRDDLAARHRAAAEGQHRACPLYRQACLRWLPSDEFPAGPAAEPRPGDSFAAWLSTADAALN